MERLIKNILRIALLFVSALAYGQAESKWPTECAPKARFMWW